MEYQLNIQNLNNNTPPQCPAAVQCTQSHLALTLCVHLKLKHNLSGERSVEPVESAALFYSCTVIYVSDACCKLECIERGLRVTL